MNADLQDTIAFFKTKGILKSSMKCGSCGEVMTWTAKQSVIDQYVWKCQNKRCSKYKTTLSIRTNSFLGISRISLQTWIDLLYRWSNEESFVAIQRSLTVSTPTLIKIFKTIRKCIFEYFEANPVRLGGENVICQIDESLFCHKQKYHRDRVANHQVWVFGIVDTSFIPARGIMRVVPNRSAAILRPIICEVILPGTTIHSDEWRAYSNLNALGYDHGTVNHSINFVDPRTGIHTQNVESYWNKNKTRCKKMKGVKKEFLQDYLNEFMWRDNISGDSFEKLMNLLKNYFNDE